MVIILLIILLSDKKEEEENIKKIEDQKEKEYEEEQRENENEEEKKENEKEEEEKRNIEEEYNNEMKIFSDENKGDAYSEITKLLIKENGSYRICVSGAKAKPGGKGGVQCVESYLEKDSIIEYILGGRKSGGKGGKGCGLFGGDGHNGAGLSYAESSSFLIVAGGGGGDSESGNKGGNFEEKGEGEYGGGGATQDSPGKKGDINASEQQNGKRFEGGDCRSSGDSGRYCGGGGGDGNYGGGAGDYGKKGKDGGGGGGSNYCQAIPPYKVKCFEKELNHSDSSKIIIFKKILIN